MTHAVPDAKHYPVTFVKTTREQQLSNIAGVQLRYRAQEVNTIDFCMNKNLQRSRGSLYTTLPVGVVVRCHISGPKSKPHLGLRRRT